VVAGCSVPTNGDFSGVATLGQMIATGTTVPIFVTVSTDKRYINHTPQQHGDQSRPTLAGADVRSDQNAS
jgi:hypothetical protein